MRQAFHHYRSRKKPGLRHCRRNYSIGGVITLCVMVLTVGAMSGCGELEPVVEPEVTDLQLTIDTLRTQFREAQRNLAELRIELESRRQELADAQVARAQLEGRVREAERRLTELRHVIELQREELIAARAERERVVRSSDQLQSQLKQLQKKMPKSRNPLDSEQDGASMRKGQKAVAVPSLSEAPVLKSQAAKVLATPAVLRQDASLSGQPDDELGQQSPTRLISVKPGDTLWSIARKYGSDVSQLQLLNQLSDSQIKVGQTLRVPRYRMSPDALSERADPNP